MSAGATTSHSLLVPIGLEALVVENADLGEWSDLTVDFSRLYQGDILGSQLTPTLFNPRTCPHDPGVHLHWTLPDAGLRNLARTSDAVLLRNQNRRVREDLWLVGLDDALAGKPELEPAFLGVPKNAPCIALFHSPEFFPKIEGRCFLNLAGHTHGGQIRLPGLGPLWLPPGSGRYIAGWYGTDASKLYVSKGVGTSLLRARLFARPEIAIFTIGDGK
jgi:hypothetical protein